MKVGGWWHVVIRTLERSNNDVSDEQNGRVKVLFRMTKSVRFLSECMLRKSSSPCLCSVYKVSKQVWARRPYIYTFFNIIIYEPLHLPMYV